MEMVLRNRPLGSLTIGRADTQVSTAWILFTVLVTLNALDVILTHVGIQRGVLVEDNPLMREVVNHLWSAVAVKVLALGIVGGLLYAIRSRRTVVHATLGICVAWYGFVVFWNYALLAG